ncbi:MAG: hypothetical protein L6R37_006607 [Teloschistes peruensis]|nr:MAG: hypothetical protein L6R37_006607 [Teloschistes peruensis]
MALLASLTSTGAALSDLRFEIAVRDSGEPLYAHVSVLSQSEVLKKSVEGLWKENGERKLDWQDRSVSAADKFLEWLYTSDYSCLYPAQAEEEPPKNVEEELNTKADSSYDSPMETVHQEPLILHQSTALQWADQPASENPLQEIEEDDSYQQLV